MVLLHEDPTLHRSKLISHSSTSVGKYKKNCFGRVLTQYMKNRSTSLAIGFTYISIGWELAGSKMHTPIILPLRYSFNRFDSDQEAKPIAELQLSSN